VNTNVSDIEIVAGTDGSLTVAEPLMRVRMARTNQFQPMGTEYRAYAECDIAQIPRNAMAAT
jgi:hypothetical protein